MSDLDNTENLDSQVEDGPALPMTLVGLVPATEVVALRPDASSTTLGDNITRDHRHPPSRCPDCRFYRDPARIDPSSAIQSAPDPPFGAADTRIRETWDDPPAQPHIFVGIWADPVVLPKPKLVIINPRYAPEPAESLQQAVHWRWNDCPRTSDEQKATERVCRQTAALNDCNVVYIRSAIHSTTGNKMDGKVADGPHITAHFCKKTPAEIEYLYKLCRTCQVEDLDRASRAWHVYVRLVNRDTRATQPYSEFADLPDSDTVGSPTDPFPYGEVELDYISYGQALDERTWEDLPVRHKQTYPAGHAALGLLHWRRIRPMMDNIRETLKELCTALKLERAAVTQCQLITENTSDHQESSHQTRTDLPHSDEYLQKTVAAIEAVPLYPWLRIGKTYSENLELDSDYQRDLKEWQNSLERLDLEPLVQLGEPITHVVNSLIRMIKGFKPITPTCCDASARSPGVSTNDHGT